MSWNGVGTFNRQFSWVADKAAGLDISSSRMDTDTNDIASNGFGNCLTRDGQGAATANLPMGGFHHTGVGNGGARTDYSAMGQVQDGLLNWTVASGTSDAIVATYTPALTALSDGQECWFRATAANTTTTPTFNPNGLGAHTITKTGGTALLAGDIHGNLTEVGLRYDLANTRWELINPPVLPAGGLFLATTIGVGTTTPLTIGTAAGVGIGVSSGGVGTIGVTPNGNANATTGGIVCQMLDQPAANTNGGTGLEYAIIGTIKSTHNGGSIGPDKVGVFGSCELAGANSGQGWGGNFVLTADSGAPLAALGVEVDVNNNSGIARNYSNLSAAIYGIAVTGISSSVSTAAILLAGGPWFTGIAFDNFRSTSSQYGIDFFFDQSNSFAGAAINCKAKVSASYVATFVNTNGTNSDLGILVGGGTNASPAGGDTAALINFVSANPSLQCGSITRNSTGVSYNTTSDHRLKTNISDVTGAVALDTLMRLRPVNYARISDPESRMHVGFLAQELYGALPDAVTPGGDDPGTDPWMVDHSAIVPTLVAATQELARRLDRHNIT